jgi:hypothetical protein
VRRLGRALLVPLVLFGLGAVGLVLLRPGSLPKKLNALRTNATTQTIARGEYLAQAGDCVACHTAPGGKLFAGGRAMPTPFGTLYTSNVTPDRDTGIGKWTADQFYSMMHTGRLPGRRPALSGDAVRLLYQDHARRQRRDLRVHAIRPAGEAAEQAA